MGQMEMHKGVLYIDTPGLGDYDQAHERAAQEIVKALQQNRHYRVFFFFQRPEYSGDRCHIKAADVHMVRTVLYCAPITQYSVIMNGLRPKIHAKLTQKCTT